MNPRTASLPRAARRAVDHFSVALLLLVGAIGVTAWVPTLARIVWEPAVPAVRPGLERAMRSKGYAVGPPEVAGHPRISGGLLDPRHLYDRPPHGSGSPLVLEFDADQPGVGVTRRDITLLDRADDEAEEVLTVKRGQTLAVIQQIGEWVLLAKREGDRIVYGWARTPDVAILP